MTTKEVTVHGIRYTMRYGSVEGPMDHNAPIRYTAILSAHAFAGGDELVDRVLAKELAQDAKVTAGEMYRERPRVEVEEIIELRHQESVSVGGSVFGGSYAQDVFPREAKPTHLRYVLRRNLSLDYTIAERKIHDVRVVGLDRPYLWTPEGSAMIG